MNLWPKCRWLSCIVGNVGGTVLTRKNVWHKKNTVSLILLYRVWSFLQLSIMSPLVLQECSVVVFSAFNAQTCERHRLPIQPSWKLNPKMSVALLSSDSNLSIALQNDMFLCGMTKFQHIKMSPDNLYKTNWRVPSAGFWQNCAFKEALPEQERCFRGIESFRGF